MGLLEHESTDQFEGIAPGPISGQSRAEEARVGLSQSHFLWRPTRLGRLTLPRFKLPRLPLG